MALTKAIAIDGKEVLFKASAAIGSDDTAVLKGYVYTAPISIAGLVLFL